MTPFAIAGIQMPIGRHDNIKAMQERLERTMHTYPWVQLVLFSELAPFGTGREFAQAMPARRKHNSRRWPRSMAFGCCPARCFRSRRLDPEHDACDQSRW